MRLLLCVLTTLVVPSAVRAQDCEIASRGEFSASNAGTPQEVAFISNAVWVCRDGRRIKADNAVLSRASGRISLNGNVQFQDSARTMTANSAEYFTQQRIMSAWGSVVLIHRTTNSVIRSDAVEYREVTKDRAESLVRATGLRPRAVLRQAEKPDSTTLDAQQIEIIADDRLRGTGDAVLTRDSLRAFSYVIDYSQKTRVLEVTGLGARVEMPRYQMFGDSITARIGEDDELQDVLTRHNARLESEDMRLTAPAAKLFFANGGVIRLVAMKWQPQQGAEPAARPHVENVDFRMDADSLDVLAPDQRITEAVAVGGAYGERITPDSLKALLPAADAEVTRLIANDWMRGDTVRAFFTDNPQAARDTTASTRLMERLLARGTPAQSMYRLRDRDRPELKLSINYMVATSIEVLFREGAVAEVFSGPDAVGMFLQPAEAARRARNNSNGGGGPPRQQ